MPAPTAHVRVNGHERPTELEPERSLLFVLRNEFGLTGAKYGCGEGECGACTVLLDGAPVRACQVPIAEVGDREVVTPEGLAPPGRPSAVQRGFLESGAYQCGFCTPGMVVRATALLRENPSPSKADVKAALDRNLCRCGGYPAILRAVARAAEIARTEGGGP